MDRRPFELPVPAVLVAVLVLVAGWWATWFLCDDAFIAFRYAGNLHDGEGLVWNPAPWRPVEGYTSLLWVLVLYAAWGATGLEPPATANVLSLLFSIASLLLIAGRLRTLALPPRVERFRPWLAAVVLVGIAGNDTFATWASSGLETAMFGTFAIGWTLLATAPRATWSGRSLAGLAALAALACLTRPDGLLLVAATLVVAAQRLGSGALTPGATLRGLLPLLAPAVHLGWRRWYYGAWLPNTYYAKVATPWPESGLRYLYCFAVEHGLWLLLPLALAFGLRRALRSETWANLRGDGFPALVAVGTWLGYVGSYTLVVGGDHFGYRIYAHLVPLLALGAFAMVRTWRPAAMLPALVLGTLTVDGVGWATDLALVGREAEGYVRVGSRVPAVLRPLLADYNRCRAWLHVHRVGLSTRFHGAACALWRTGYPRRASGLVAGAAPGQRLVWRQDSVGVTGWALRDVAIVDGHGLNDRVVARTPPPEWAGEFDADKVRTAFPAFDVDRDGRLGPDEIAAASHLLTATGPGLHPATWADLLLALGDGDGDDALDPEEYEVALRVLVPPRYMAHERTPPPGYVEALRPNVTGEGGVLRVLPEVTPLTDDELRAVEAEWWARAGG